MPDRTASHGARPGVARPSMRMAVSASSWAGSATGAAPAWNRAGRLGQRRVPAPTASARAARRGSCRRPRRPAGWPRAGAQRRGRGGPVHRPAPLRAQPAGAGLGHHRDCCASAVARTRPTSPGRSGRTAPTAGRGRPARTSSAVHLGEDRPVAERWGTGRGGGHDTNLEETTDSSGGHRTREFPCAATYLGSRIKSRTATCGWRDLRARAVDSAVSSRPLTPRRAQRSAASRPPRARRRR